MTAVGNFTYDEFWRVQRAWDKIQAEAEMICFFEGHQEHTDSIVGKVCLRCCENL